MKGEWDGQQMRLKGMVRKQSKNGENGARVARMEQLLEWNNLASMPERIS